MIWNRSLVNCCGVKDANGDVIVTVGRVRGWVCENTMLRVTDMDSLEYVAEKDLVDETGNVTER